jgi:adhesin/invasin
MTRSKILRITPLLAALALAACDRDGGDGGDAVGPVSSTHSTVTAAPATIVADGADAATITATARDASGRAIGNKNAVFTVSGSANQLSATTIPTGPNGAAVLSLRSTKAEAKTVSVTIDGVAIAATANVAFVAGALDPAASTTAVAPESVTAGEAPVDVTATARDAHGNPIAGLDVTFSATGGTLGATTVTTGADGIASTTLSSTVATDVVVTAKAGADVLGAAQTVSFVPGAAAAVVVTASPAAAVTAGAAFGATVELRDAFGNVVSTSQSVTLALSPGVALVGTATVPAVDGVATFAGLSVEVAGSYALVATSGGVTSQPSAAFDVVPAAAARLAFSQSPAGATAGELLAPAAIVRIEDGFGNLVTSGLETVSVALQGGTAGAVLGGTTSALAILGEATFANLTVDRAGSYSLAASSAGLAGAGSSAFGITAAAPDATNSEVVAAAATATAGQGVALTATVRDLFGNPVAGALVGFRSAAADATFTPPAATTDAAGVALSSLTATRAGDVVVRGFVGTGPDFAVTATVAYGPGAPSAATSTLVAAPSSVEADGATSISLVATVMDAFENPISGATVALASSGTATLVQPGPTTSGGVATGSITSTAVGAQTVTASVGGVALASAAIEFLTTDRDGDGVPNREDAFPDDPAQFIAYNTVFLPNLGGGFATATAVSGANLVVGISEDATGLVKGAAWTVSGTLTTPAAALQPLAGNGYSAAYAVDANGTVVGESEKAAQYVPVVWAGVATPSELALGSLEAPAAAYGISGGRIVGEARSGAAEVAVLWPSATAAPVELASLGGTRSSAYAVAGSYVVGESTLAGGANRGAVWTLDASGNPGAPAVLAPLAGDVSSIALSVDPSGRIVGESESASGAVSAVSWNAATPAVAELLGAGSAQAVSGARVAGYAGLPTGPLVWDVRSALFEGVLTSPFQFSQAYGVNAASVVVGVLDGGAFAAVPVTP